jgi:NADP-dependent 3-hydroxy acid dehydrogenase YdfG
MTAQTLAVIVGAGGALGPAMRTALNHQGYRVVAIARRAGADKTATWVQADVTDPASMAAVYDTV